MPAIMRIDSCELAEALDHDEINYRRILQGLRDPGTSLASAIEKIEAIRRVCSGLALLQCDENQLDRVIPGRKLPLDSL